MRTTNKSKRMLLLSLIAFIHLVGRGTAPAPAAEPPRNDGLLAPAERLVQQKPSVLHQVGLVEMKRAAGQSAAALEELARVGQAFNTRKHAADLDDLVCWRMLPVGEVGRTEFRKQVEALKKKDSQAGWLGVYELYQAFLEQDRAALLAAAGDEKKRTPDRFPTVWAEQAHHALLLELGLSRPQAGLEVLAHRSYEALHALRDLDRGLTREADFLRGADRPADAQKLEACRDRLRRAYLAASRHVVERLFALNLLERTRERDELLAKTKTLPYLSDRQALARLLEGTDEEEAWSKIIAPLLKSEVDLVLAAPDLGGIRPAAVKALAIQADQKTIVNDDNTNYQGNVLVRLGRHRMSCAQLSVTRTGATAVILSGLGKVTVRGVPGFEAGIRADHFTFHSDAGRFTFLGDVRLYRREGTLKLLSCTVAATGQVADAKSLLDDFRDAKDVDRKLQLLPRIAAVYTDDELSDEVRYLFALNLLRRHLTWHLPYPPPKSEIDHSARQLVEYALRDEKEWSEEDSRWGQAMRGEPWMLGDIPQALKESWKKISAADKAKARVVISEDQKYTSIFWRIKDPRHPEIARVLNLLGGIKDENIQKRARSWAFEIRRNNTVLTLDVTGGYGPGKDAPVVMDVRGAEKVSFALYRIQKPEDLPWVTGRIGTDFMYRDYGLQYGYREAGKDLVKERARNRRLQRVDLGEMAREEPEFPRSKPVLEWDRQVADCKALDLHRHALPWDYDDDDDDDWRESNKNDDHEYFDDDCERCRDRINKKYRPYDKEHSSWQCDRIVEIPGKALREAGAYVLAAEANGQIVYAPILVDPLSMTLRRCRDGVFVLVSDREGKQPIAGANVLGEEMLGKTVTDAQGAAFARMFAAGDRAVVAHKDGRFALGGFGKLFDGIYRSPRDRDREKFERLARAQGARAQHPQQQSGQVYADRHVIAAYTDRPTYRPGQEVQFKLIVRLLGEEKNQAATKNAEPAFRAADFDLAANLVLPEKDAEVRYDVLDPKGRAVGAGTMNLNEYGTAAGKFGLYTETATGAYSLRVHIDGMDHIVPEVFAVQYYRRPNFELKVDGVPPKLKKAEDLIVKLAGHYYFGKPVAGGKVNVQLVRPERRKPLAEIEGVLDAAGNTTVTLKLSIDLDGGKFFVLCDLTDDSGRTVSQALPLEIEVPRAARAMTGLAALPHFLPFNKPFEVETSAKEVVAQQGNDIDGNRHTFAVRQGKAVVQLPAPGWYTVTAGEETVDLFVYGGTSHPFQNSGPAKEQKELPHNAPPVPPEPCWVDLTNYHGEEYGEAEDWHHGDRSHRLLALFDRHHAAVGDKFRVLVYAPYKHARLLFTIEGRTVVDYFITDTPASDSHYHVIEIPVKKRYLPNFYLQGRILAGQKGDELDPKKIADRALAKQRMSDFDDDSEDPRWCRVDVLDPTHVPGEEQLKVRIETDRKEYRPGGKVDVRIQIADMQDRPRTAEVSLSAVDESVFTFGEDRVEALAQLFSDPHPPQRYLPKKWRGSIGNKWDVLEKEQRMIQLAMKMAKQSEQLQRAAALASAQKVQELAKRIDVARDQVRPLAERRSLSPALFGGQMPVGSFPLARLRTDFRETAAWQPQLRAGPDGVIQTSFNLPDSLTQYRLSAVALTRETEIGTGRAELTVSMPLAVQVFLPRFAVEKDRLLAVGLVHNNGPRDRTCAVTWEIQGARLDGAAQPIDDWQAETGAGKTVGRGRLTVPAAKSARVGLWLTMDRAGPVTVVCRAGDAKDADAETRTLVVQPIGRERDVALTGTFTGRHRLKLPAGFVAHDLQISLEDKSSFYRVVHSLDYLIDYPHGCVEQTMSRFYPAVMVKQATRQIPNILSPEVAAKLPDVLEKGLLRLCNFQHADGGWGWWEHDQTNDPMTVYVVTGLARCRLAGKEVDAQVLGRGCEYLKKEIRQGKFDTLLTARACLALALAGQLDRELLEPWARHVLERTDQEARLTMALACRAAGRHEPAQRLWSFGRDWQPSATEQLALKLSAQLAFGAPYAECHDSAARLVNGSGTHWENTRVSAEAVVALCWMLGFTSGKTPLLNRVKIQVDGKTELDVIDREHLKKFTHWLHLPTERLPAKEALEIDMDVAGGTEMVYSISAVGIQRLDKIEPIGKEVRMHRTLETLDGQPLVGPVHAGQVFAVRVVVDLAESQDYVLVESPRPAGCEFAHDRLLGKATPAHVDFRDDRVCAFFTRLPEGMHALVYYLRAETPGTSQALPGRAYPMYNHTRRGETGATRIEIVP